MFFPPMHSSSEDDDKLSHREFVNRILERVLEIASEMEDVVAAAITSNKAGKGASDDDDDSPRAQ